MSPSPWQTPLRQWAAWSNKPPRVAVVGIGNSLRSDDIAGVLVARQLQQSRLIRDLDSVLVLEAGHAPENTTADLRRFAPEIVILVDAAEMSQVAGLIRWVAVTEIDGMSASTHTLPLSMLAKYLTLELDCEVKILGVQPRSIEFGDSVSEEVLLAVEEITSGLASFLTETTVIQLHSLN